MRRQSTLLSLLPAGLLLAACGTGAPSTQPATTSPTQAAATTAPTSQDFLKVVDVAGHKVNVVCVGPTDTGRPTVIFESGLGADLGQWSPVLTELQKTDRACAYERAGTGQSDPAAGPVTTTDQVEGLRALLEAIEVEPPYVLVGFSLGGWNVLVHNDLHGGDVVGAVMADVRPPGVSASWLAALPPAASAEPEGIRLNREELTVFEADPGLNPEQLDLKASAAEAVATKGFDDKPLIVLAAADTAGITDGLDGELAATFEAAWWELQQAMADQSSAGRLEMVEKSTHDMPWERSDAIVAAILEVLGS
jgi:pimeloyl-ACP methyl ester carboxylesterase